MIVVMSKRKAPGSVFSVCTAISFCRHFNLSCYLDYFIWTLVINLLCFPFFAKIKIRIIIIEIIRISGSTIIYLKSPESCQSHSRMHIQSCTPTYYKMEPELCKLRFVNLLFRSMLIFVYLNHQFTASKKMLNSFGMHMIFLHVQNKIIKMINLVYYLLLHT